MFVWFVQMCKWFQDLFFLLRVEAIAAGDMARSAGGTILQTSIQVLGDTFQEERPAAGSPILEFYLSNAGNFAWFFVFDMKIHEAWRYMGVGIYTIGRHRMMRGRGQESKSCWRFRNDFSCFRELFHPSSRSLLLLQNPGDPLQCWCWARCHQSLQANFVAFAGRRYLH